MNGKKVIFAFSVILLLHLLYSTGCMTSNEDIAQLMNAFSFDIKTVQSSFDVIHSVEYPQCIDKM